MWSQADITSALTVRTALSNSHSTSYRDWAHPRGFIPATSTLTVPAWRLASIHVRSLRRQRRRGHGRNGHHSWPQLEKIRTALGPFKARVVMSDMAPRASGDGGADTARCVRVACGARARAQQARVGMDRRSHVCGQLTWAWLLTLT